MRISRGKHAAAKEQLLKAIATAAAQGQRLPSDAMLSRNLGVGNATIKLLFNTLRDEKRIRWRVEFCGKGIGKIRIVTITATGQMTAGKPKYVGRPPKPQARRFLYRPLSDRDPNDLCGGRRLSGPEFEFYKAQYEARDRAERSRAQA